MLKLSVEQKGVLVPIGELTVYLDGLTVTDQEELAPLTNGNAANGTSERSIYMLGVGDGKTAIFNDKEEAQRESHKNADTCSQENMGILSPCTI